MCGVYSLACHAHVRWCVLVHIIYASHGVDCTHVYPSSVPYVGRSPAWAMRERRWKCHRPQAISGPSAMETLGLAEVKTCRRAEFRWTWRRVKPDEMPPRSNPCNRTCWGRGRTLRKEWADAEDATCGSVVDGKALRPALEPGTRTGKDPRGAPSAPGTRGPTARSRGAGDTSHELTTRQPAILSFAHAGGTAVTQSHYTYCILFRTAIISK